MNRVGVEYTKAARPWRLGLLNRILDGEGVPQALHALLQVLDLAFLLRKEQMFDPIQPRGEPVLHRFHFLFHFRNVLFAGCGLEALVDHLRQVFNCGVVFHMYSSIGGLRRVSVAGIGIRCVRRMSGRDSRSSGRGGSTGSGKEEKSPG